MRKTAQLTDTCGPSLDVGYFSGSVTEYSDKKHFIKKGFILAYNSWGDTVRPQEEGAAAAVWGQSITSYQQAGGSKWTGSEIKMDKNLKTYPQSGPTSWMFRNLCTQHHQLGIKCLLNTCFYGRHFSFRPQLVVWVQSQNPHKGWKRELILQIVLKYVWWRVADTHTPYLETCTLTKNQPGRGKQKVWTLITYSLQLWVRLGKNWLLAKSRHSSNGLLLFIHKYFNLWYLVHNNVQEKRPFHLHYH